MRILDIDLDFFLDEIAQWRKRNTQRLNKNHYTPWNSGQVECFLEKNLGLDKEHPIPGAYFIHHDEVYDWFKQKVTMEQIVPPASIVHLDAHSDMATGMNGCHIYIMETMLRKAIPARYEISDATGWYKLNPGNFLVFMAACEWIDNLIFVKHHASEEQYNSLYFKNHDPATNIIQLKAYKPGLVQNLAGGTNLFTEIKKHHPIILGPEIPYREMKWCDYTDNAQFDYILLTQSPSFTPSTSDKLIEVIKQYMII